MAAILVGGFAIVVCVNFYMASLAVGGFHGVVVENSYVASQKFNDWLEEAEDARRLGWSARTGRDDEGYVVIDTQIVPPYAQVRADLRRPLGEHEYASLTFTPQGDGRYRSTQPVESGRWTMRLFIEAEGRRWAEESEI